MSAGVRAAGAVGVPGRVRGWPDITIAAGACLLALVLGALLVVAPLEVTAFVAGLGVVALVAAQPPAAAYLLLALTPLTAGVERGALLPLLRPGEAILALVLAGLVLRGLLALARGAQPRLRITAVDWAILALAVTGSVIPLLTMVARGREVTQDDLFYATYLWKYAAVFLVVRAAVRTERQVRTCLWIVLASGLVVGGLAILQSRDLLGVDGLLSALYTEGEGQEVAAVSRGTSTLSSSFAVADVMVFCLAVAAGLARRAGVARVPLAVAALVFVLGVAAAGQASGIIALVVGAVVIGLVTHRLRLVLLVGGVAGALAAVTAAPLIVRRLRDIDEFSGLPSSWTGPDGRWSNLKEYFWPELFSDLNWLTGVRAAGRVPAREPWREWVWIESGHTWLLWTGGVLFFVTCCVFLVIAIRAVARVAARRSDAIGAAALGALAALWVNVFLLTLDVHLTLRGAADLLFTLLALALVAAPAGAGSATPAGLPDG